MQKSGYRTDIDGIRALAVLLVAIFHINENLIPGGFVGVDVFFVISGYLITGNILRDYQRGTFTFSEFYRRRIRRILPAMFTVTFVTLIAGTLLLLPEDVNQLALSSLATALSGANIFFTYFLDTSYFATDSNTVPLLHMWSLGVEEQFYLIWPIFLIFFIRLRNWLIWALLALIIVSIAIGEWQIRSGQLEWAYYMLPSRAFQLAIGGALAFLPPISRGRAWLLAPAGLFLILTSSFILSGTSPFPGLNAIPVTIGTAALLASGVHNTPLTRAFSLPPLRAIGLISYSLYLWHWPVLAFQRYYYGDLDPIQQVLSFIAMMGLATISYLFIELPFRHSNLSFRQMLSRFVIAPSIALAVLAAGLVVTDGYGPYRYTDYRLRLEKTQTASAPYTFDYLCQEYLITRSIINADRCVIGDGRPRVLLYGDSNAAHYIGVVGELAKQAGVSFRNYAHSSCVPIDGDPSPFVPNKRLKACSDSHRLTINDLENYDVIFIGAAWDIYSASGNKSGADLAVHLQSLVERLTSDGKKIILLDTAPRQPKFDAQCGRKSQKIEVVDCATIGAADYQPKFSSELHKIAENNHDVYVLSVREQVCQFGRCPAFDVDGTALYFDRLHFSAEGSWRIGRRLISTPAATPIVELLHELRGDTSVKNESRYDG
ncbi:acyltransferase family protein [Nitratireductor sp. OM-1]|uniref:acyltransferase family protein n=1 Tax=Nitratireductor sp. OM-1 TaxID=1756988 RepID=UPI0013AEF230|nr:acyltransferase family protein [Nitratireductor sp. OM-1]